MSAVSLKKQIISSLVKLSFLHPLGIVIGIAMSVVMSRGLGAQGYGVYVYAMTIITLLVAVNEMGVPGLIFRRAARSRANSEWPVLRSMLIRFSQILIALSAVILLASAVALWWFSGRLSVHLSAHKLHTVIWLLPLVPVMTMKSIVGAVLHGMNHVLIGSVIGVVISLLQLVILALMFYLAPSARFPEYAAAVFLCVNAAGLSVLCVWLWRRLPAEFFQGETEYHTRRWLNEALPFVLLAGVGLVHVKIDIFVLGLFVSAEEVANYQIAVRAAFLAMVGAHIVREAIAPQINILYQQGDYRKLQRLVSAGARVMFASAAGLTAITFIFGKEIIALLYGSEFYGVYPALVVLNIGILGLATSGPVVALVIAVGREKDLLRSTVAGIVLNVALNLILIPRYGITGAAAATSISLVARKFWLDYIVRTKVNLKCTIFSWG